MVGLREAAPLTPPTSPQQPFDTFLWAARRAPGPSGLGYGCGCSWGLCSAEPDPGPGPPLRLLLLHMGRELRASLWSTLRPRPQTLTDPVPPGTQPPISQDAAGINLKGGGGSLETLELLWLQSRDLGQLGDPGHARPGSP